MSQSAFAPAPTRPSTPPAKAGMTLPRGRCEAIGALLVTTCPLGELRPEQMLERHRGPKMCDAQLRPPTV